MALSESAEGRLHRGLREWLREVFPPGITDAEILDWEARLLSGRAKFRDVLERVLIDSVDLGASIAFDQLAGVGIMFDYTLANTAARDWANRYVGQLITQIDETTRRAVQEAVTRYIGNGESLQNLVSDLQGTGFSRRRARLIAMTETTRAYAEGSTLSYEQSGVVKEFEWRTANDERVCPTCGGNAGKRFPLNGLTKPPAHPGCRCGMAPVVDLSP